MDRDPPRAFAAALLAFALAAGPVAPARGEVTLYRCTDASGTVTVQDTPCVAGTRQEVRTMQRPQDPPPGSRTPPPAQAPPATPPARSVQTIVMRTPQPMYECMTPDGDRYTSDTGDGNPRFVPLWTLGVPYHGAGHGPITPPTIRDRPVASPPRGGLSTAPVNNISIPSARNVPQPPPPPPRRPPPGHGHERGHGYGYGGGGTWIRDSCTALPAAEVCARLRERRETIRRQAFNAQESERRTLRTEERTLNARLAEDCGL
ncbi:DUF4124 domain-containing protein [Luteimonas yindakuii]|uniref:DUF4124 domain-containing protein n=1 Tax=Luteimonas yindakuii TaxID=2565782 RepID=A0A4Z1RG38_9GAMM|nr:DUF4124 domain-containing protein [Luteimonas yindakuii]QCO66831.1 DUF4124 domain-containing protein [Luteimonas yindakuii]TKS53059.1 DUF4124 domain-containing protein [Luteimonas yindakuii]